MTNPNTDSKLKVFALLLFFLAIELVFFKFIPDLGTATLPDQGTSGLASFRTFEDYYLTPQSVMYPRFAGPLVLHSLAKALASHLHSSDVRLHPLRIAAGLLTPLYAAIGLLPVLFRRTRYHWKTYATLYCAYCTLSLYVFYPSDMPSIALIAVAAFFVLEEQLVPALLIMLVTGLYRESALHIVAFVFAWALCSRAVAPLRRATWFAAFAAAFTVEYTVVRKIYPGKTDFMLDLHEIFLGRGLWSLTCIVTLAIIAIVPMLYLATRTTSSKSDWRDRFFVLNCAATPAWILFYRVMGGNLSELRMLIPILIPIFYGLAMLPTAGVSPTPIDR